MTRRARVIHVDWQAWRFSDATTRRLCGARSYLDSDGAERAEAYARAVAELRATFADPEAPAAEARARPMLPGMAHWLMRRRSGGDP